MCLHSKTCSLCLPVTDGFTASAHTHTPCLGHCMFSHLQHASWKQLHKQRCTVTTDDLWHVTQQATQVALRGNSLHASGCAVQQTAQMSRRLRQAELLRPSACQWPCAASSGSHPKEPWLLLPAVLLQATLVLLLKPQRSLDTTFLLPQLLARRSASCIPACIPNHV